MAALTFYGGVGEIGGNKILVEAGKAKIWLDFGVSFGFGEPYFQEFTKPRALADMFEFGLMPELKGLYSQDALAGSHIKFAKPNYDGVFLSHAHFDHCRHVDYLHEGIPVHCGFGTRLFLWAVDGCQKETFEEHYPSMKTFRGGDEIKVKDIVVRPISVDHSIPAAYGYIVETPDGNIVYTGDIRFHGPMGGLSENFVKEAKKAKPIALITEGTRVSPHESRKNYSQEDVHRLSLEVIEGTKGLATCSFYPKDIDRIRSFYEIAQETGRKFVISDKTAFLLKVLEGDKHLDAPRVDAEDIVVFDKGKKPAKWKTEMIGDNWVMPGWVKAHQGDCLLDLPSWAPNPLVDIKPKKGSNMIYSISEPFPEEGMDFVNPCIEDTVLHLWAKHFGMGFHSFHASGHASKEEILGMVKEIGAEKVFPVHTQCPELFTGAESVQVGKRYAL